MNVKEIYNKFYETHLDQDRTIADMRREEIMQFLESKGLDRSDLCTVDDMLGELCVAHEERAFKDGFAVGVDHITGAVAFASQRLGK